MVRIRSVVRTNFNIIYNYLPLETPVRKVRLSLFIYSAKFIYLEQVENYYFTKMVIYLIHVNNIVLQRLWYTPKMPGQKHIFIYNIFYYHTTMQHMYAPKLVFTHCQV